jgi:hypothetical protein
MPSAEAAAVPSEPAVAVISAISAVTLTVSIAAVIVIVIVRRGPSMGEITGMIFTRWVPVIRGVDKGLLPHRSESPLAHGFEAEGRISTDLGRHGDPEDHRIGNQGARYLRIGGRDLRAQPSPEIVYLPEELLA